MTARTGEALIQVNRNEIVAGSPAQSSFERRIASNHLESHFFKSSPWKKAGKPARETPPKAAPPVSGHEEGPLGGLPGIEWQTRVPGPPARRNGRQNGTDISGQLSAKYVPQHVQARSPRSSASSQRSSEKSSVSTCGIISSSVIGSLPAVRWQGAISIIEHQCTRSAKDKICNETGSRPAKAVRTRVRFLVGPLPPAGIGSK
jgi:hypothetical protein